MNETRYHIHCATGSLILRWQWVLTLMLAAMLAIPKSHAASDPQQLVKQATADILQSLETDPALNEDPQQLFQLVDRVLDSHMDFRRMAGWVLGKHWKRASDVQRDRFTREFRGLLVRTYATALANYTGQQVKYLPARYDAGSKKVTIKTEIQQPAGPSIPVNYSLYQDDGKWLAYDVIIDGVSMVANYRASFNVEIRNQGLDQLIQSLASRNQVAEETNTL